MYKHSIRYLLGIVIFFIYLFLSVYESYIDELFVNITRPYLILFTLYMFLNMRVKSIGVNQLNLALWLVFYYITLLWTPNLHQASLYVGTVSIMCLITIISENCFFPKPFVDVTVGMYKWLSISMGILGVFFSEPLNVNNTVRMVLTLGDIQPDPNNLVVLYAVGSGLALVSIRKNEKHILINIAAFLINSYCILITGSRSGILILAVQLLIWLFFISSNMNKALKCVVVATIILLIGHVMRNYISYDTIERLFGLGDLAFVDGTGREDKWRDAINFFKNSPIVGNGWGSYPCHNTFLTLLVDVGLVGFALFALYIVRLLIKIIKYREYTALMIIVPGFIQAILLDAQNKRFFWNAIILAVLILNTYVANNKYSAIDQKNTNNY